MQFGRDDGSSSLPQMPFWSTDFDPDGQSHNWSSLYDTTSVNSSSFSSDTVVPYDNMVESYNGATNVFSDASPFSLPLGGLDSEALSGVGMNVYGVTAMQELSHQQTGISQFIGTPISYGDHSVDASQQAHSTGLHDQLCYAAYGTMSPLLSYVEPNTLLEPAYAAVDNTCVDQSERGLPDSPTLGVFASSTEPTQHFSQLDSGVDHYETPHFSDYPCKCICTPKLECTDTLKTSALKWWVM